ncbi:uncharacterized protein LOC111323965 [Stylophora pistillata]|uniref:uncharacterized protein LOC111323965 n=1 Tax=Stylophora pistillata TaxID=50429 RepID=UPI000C039498|nr:uncharacterized protein LOC111323965 [Stylophora pistillata]
MAAKEDQELILFKLASAKLTDAQNVMAEDSDLANAKLSEAQRLMAEAGVQMKEDLNNARVKKEAVEEMTRTLNHVHFASSIKLNVGGKIYKTTLATLRKDSNSMLKIPKECSTTFYKHDKLDFHLYILNYLRDGDLLYPEDQTAKEQLLKEAKFYQVQGIINHLEEALSFGIPSSIIKDKNHESYLLSWLSPGTTISLMYRASVDGETPADFHRCCDEKGPTLVVIKSGEYICGGYTSKSWTSASPIKAIEDSYSFLFTLENPSGSEPVKINPKADAHGGIRCDSRKGPSFGTSQFYDLEVWRTFNATRPEEILSYFDLGYGFICPESVDNIPYFTGKNPFKIEELEVFKVKF